MKGHRIAHGGMLLPQLLPARLLLPTGLLLAGCAVGPTYHRPAPPTAQRFLPEPLQASLTPSGRAGQAGPTQTLITGADIPGRWWEMFRCPALDSLVTRALQRNQDLAAAQAALKQARENVYAQEGNFLPSVDAGFAPSRNKTPLGTLSPIAATNNPYYSLYTAQVTVSYNPDVFGLNRRQTESEVALGEAQRFQLEATYLTLTTNLVAAAINEASLRGQIDATNQLIASQQATLSIMRRQLALGDVARVDVLAQQAATTAAEATLPPLQKQLGQQRDQIAALSGSLSDRAVPETFTLEALHLPDTLPVSLPSRLVAQRPDILQAEQNLHSANALIGVAIANRLPLINLTAELGSESLAADKLFTPGNGFWTLAGSITQPIFDGGILLHRERNARAAFDEAAATYRSTVIDAFQNVADSLRALKADTDAVGSAAIASQDADATYAIVQGERRLGAVAYVAQLSAQQSVLQNRLTLIQSQAARLADSAALIQSLGGGWWNRQDATVRDLRGNDALAVVGLH